MPNILICDDERSICEMLDITLRREGYKVETANSGEMAKRKLESAIYDVVVTDIKMPNINGIEVLRHAHKLSPESAVILITAVDDFDAAVDAVKAGGFLAGTPTDIIEQLKAVEKRYPGIDRVICATPLGTPLDVQLEDLDRFAKDVIPAFRDKKVAAAAE